MLEAADLVVDHGLEGRLGSRLVGREHQVAALEHLEDVVHRREQHHVGVEVGHRLDLWGLEQVPDGEGLDGGRQLDDGVEEDPAAGVGDAEVVDVEHLVERFLCKVQPGGLLVGQGQHDPRIRIETPDGVAEQSGLGQVIGGRAGEEDRFRHVRCCRSGAG